VTLALKNVSHTYEDLEVVRDVTLDTRQGECIGIIGKSGCGKSSLLKIMAGLEQPRAGRVLYDGTELYHLSDRRFNEIQSRTGYVFQDAALLANLSIFENIALPIRYHTHLSETEIRTRVFDLLDRFELHLKTEQRPAVFALGTRKMVSLVRAIVLEPDCLFMDDPTGGIDRAARECALDSLLRLKKETRMTTIFVTQDNELLSLLADRLLVMHDHTLIADGTVTEILDSNNPEVRSIIESIDDDDDNRGLHDTAAREGQKGTP